MPKRLKGFIGLHIRGLVPFDALQTIGRDSGYIITKGNNYLHIETQRGLKQWTI